MQQMLLGAGGLPPTTYDQATFTGRRWNASAGGDYQSVSSISAAGTGTGVGGGTHSHTSYLSSIMNTLYTWTCPAGVDSVDVLCIGAGGGGAGGGKYEYYIEGEGGMEQVYIGYGGSGGSLVYKNNIPVTAGTTYYVAVGTAGAPGPAVSGSQGQVGKGAGPSWFGTGSSGGSGTRYWPSGSYILADGGNGGGLSAGASAASGQSSGTGYTGHTLRTGGAGSRGGGGAAGYSGSGGSGGNTSSSGSAGAGGGGGGGALASDNGPASGGGGVGIYGQGSNGAGGTHTNSGLISSTTAGKGGSSGGAAGGSQDGNYAGLYGGGGGGGYSLKWGGWGGPGAVRILWSSDNSARSYPSTNTGNL